MQGDQGAFADLATQHIDRCYALSYRILRDQPDAQDATQQALLHAWRDLPTLRDPDRFDAWLYRTVVHACYVRARSQRRWTARVRVLSVAPPTEPDVATSVVMRDTLDRAFRQLTPEQRAIVVMHHHLGYALTEIAATLGIPEGTARSRLHYAVRQLRVVLEPDDRLATTSQERHA
jgi:RNA polymerase sigma-70 factor (ECF subfamily)